jgi:periplasmic divalent cation tolerance protein
VTTTCESQAVAETIARLVVEERLAACAQVAGPISSVYRWEGRVERAPEWYCHMKTTAERLPELETRIKASHPYRVPEIIALPIIGGSTDYLSWIKAQVDK